MRTPYIALLAIALIALTLLWAGWRLSVVDEPERHSDYDGEGR